MTDGAEPIAEPASSALLVEIALVLLLYVVPDLFNAIAYSVMPSSFTGLNIFVFRSLALLVRSLGAIALISFVISRSGEGAAGFGIPRPRLYDLPATIGVYFALHIVNYVLWYSLMAIFGGTRVHGLAHSDLSAVSVPNGSGELLLLSIMSLANGMAEELVCRSYLITRFEQLFRSTPLAWMLSSIIFSSYHIYQGTGGIISAFGIGLTFGAIFILFRRIWPLALGHALQDFVAIAMLSK